MPKAMKIRQIKAGVMVRPPKAWYKKMLKRVGREYPRFSAKRKAQITAGIWHKYPKATKLRIVS